MPHTGTPDAPDRTEAGLRRRLAAHPNDGEALRLLGGLLFRRGDGTGGVRLLRRATAALPGDAAPRYELGVMLLAGRRWPAAAEAFREALALEPGHADALYNLAWALRRQNLTAEAEAALRTLVALQPGHGRGWFNLGNLQAGRDDLAGAEAAYRRAGDAGFAEPGLAVNQGEVLHRQGRLDEAMALYRQALAVDPGLVTATGNLANALTALGRAAEAIALYQAALAGRPDDARLLYNLALAHKALRQPEAAAGLLERAVAAAPDLAEAWNAFGLIRLELGDVPGAEQALNRALALAPGFADAHSNLGRLYSLTARAAEALACYRQALALAPDNAAIHSNLLFQMRHMPGLPRDEVFEEHRRFGRRQEALATPLPLPPPPPADADAGTDAGRRLRVGYVSPDFCEHAVMLFFEPVLEHHDRRHFEIFCYHTSTFRDAVTRRLQAAADHWRPIAHLDPDAAAALVRADGIDILVDLAGHTARNGLPVFARKPAHLQATWLGYPGTTGLTRIDYRLTDTGADRPDQGNDAFYTERLSYLAIAAVFRPPAHAPEPGPLPMRRRGHIRFGSFNKQSKIGEPVIAVWSRILTTIPDAELAMIVPGGERPEVAGRLRAAFAAHGVCGERIAVSGLQPLDTFLAMVAEVDLALDPFPYCGGTTSMLTLWMGVPLICRQGRDAASASTPRLLECLGLGGLVAVSDDAYVKIAAYLAGWPAFIAEARAALRDRLRASPLFDEERLVRSLEANYRDWWHRLPSG